MPPKNSASPTSPVVVVRRRSARQPVTPPPSPVPGQAPAAPVQPLPVPPPATQPLAATATPLPHGDADPSVAAAQRAHRRQEALALLELLQARWPQAFVTQPAAVRPLATGLHRTVIAQLPEYTPRLIRYVITLWRRRHARAYLQALAAGGPRYDLEGQPRGTVTAEEQQQARQELVAWQARRRERVGRTPRRSSPPDRSTPVPEGN